MPRFDFFTAALLLGSGMFLRYAVISAGFYVAIWKKWKEKWKHRKLCFAKLRPNQMRGEVKNALITTFVYGVVLGATMNKHVVGYTQVYFDVAERGWLYFWLSFGLIFVLHDLHFYIGHRLLHTKYLYRKVHSLHHVSTSPTPWSSYSFHWGEALTLVSFMPMFVFTIPSNFWMISAFGFVSIVFNVIGHCGYELMPRGFMHWGWHHVVNTATHHGLHHRYPDKNFSLYFNYLDRILGTNCHHYETELAKILETERGEEADHTPGRTKIANSSKGKVS